MSRIPTKFAAVKAEGRKALVTYIAAGDPDLATSQSILEALPAAGADIIELGMPFTDPVADGPTIQAAAIRALDAGTTVIKTLEMVRCFRRQNSDTPLVLMGYFNPIYRYGCDAFIRDAKEAGIDGLIIVDLPPEEDAELRVPAAAADIDLIHLISPVTPDARLKTLCENGAGFLYYVSITGVTGTASADISTVEAHIKKIRTYTDLPVAVGFGIKTPDDARAFAALADGVVVGSSLVQEIEQHSHAAQDKICDKVSALKSAL